MGCLRLRVISSLCNVCDFAGSLSAPPPASFIVNIQQTTPYIQTFNYNTIQTMNRRKPDNAIENKRGSWSQRIPSKRGLFGKKAGPLDGSASTEPTTDDSAINFELPSWENPANVVTPSIYENLPAPAKPSSPPAAKYQTSVVVNRVAKSMSPRKPPVDMASQIPADVVVTLDDSFDTFADDITFMGVREEKKSQSSRDMPIPSHISGPRSNSLRSSSSSSTSSKNYEWVRGLNGRFIKVTVGSNLESATPREGSPGRPDQHTEPSNELSDADLERMEEEMLQKVLERSKHESHASHSSLQKSKSGFDVPTSQPQTAEMTNDDQAALRDQEEALVRFAMDRSLHDSGLQSKNGPRKGEIAGTSPRHERSRDRQHGQARVVSLGSRKTSSLVRTEKNFVWKRGPNGRFVKVPIEMDQLDEDSPRQEFSSGNNHQEEEDPGRLAHVEEALVQEAVQRSMRDLYAGL